MENPTEEKAKMERLAVKAWYVLIPLFAVLILWRIYRWSQGKDDLSGIFPPIGMIFVGLATMVGSRNSPLYYLFLALGVISVVIGLVMMFRN